MSQPTTILVQKNISHTIARFHPDMVIRSETRPFTIFQFDKGKELIALGVAAVRKTPLHTDFLS